MSWAASLTQALACLECCIIQIENEMGSGASVEMLREQGENDVIVLDKAREALEILFIEKEMAHENVIELSNVLDDLEKKLVRSKHKAWAEGYQYAYSVGFSEALGGGIETVAPNPYPLTEVDEG